MGRESKKTIDRGCFYPSTHCRYPISNGFAAAIKRFFFLFRKRQQRDRRSGFRTRPHVFCPARDGQTSELAVGKIDTFHPFSPVEAFDNRDRRAIDFSYVLRRFAYESQVFFYHGATR